jgi:Uma2 family endonuclease
MGMEGSRTMAAQVERARRLFTVDEYQRMGEAGVFRPDERVELIEGEIIEMSPINPPHSGRVMNLNAMLVHGLAHRALVSPGGTVVIPPRSQPQPDILVLRRRGEISYSVRHPGPEDVLLAIEVADTSLAFDRTVKLRLYARAGIPEFWIVDVNAGRIDVHHTPAGELYRHTRQVERGASLSPEAFPDLVLSVDAILA